MLVCARSRLSCVIRVLGCADSKYCSPYHAKRPVAMASTTFRRNYSKNVRQPFHDRIKAATASHDPTAALAAFHDLTQAGFTPSVHTYSLLANAHAAAGDKHACLGILDDMEAQGISPDVVTFNTVLKILLSHLDHSEFATVFQRMVDLRVAPDAISWRLRFRIACEAGDDADVELCTRHLRDIGDGLCVQDFNALRLLHTRHRPNIRKARGVVSEMAREGISIDITTFLPILQMCQHACDAVTAEAVFREMVANGIQPDRKSFNILLNTHCKALDLSSALSTLQEMKSHNLSPDVFTFASLLYLHARRADVDAVTCLVDEMAREGVNQSPHTLNNVLLCHVIRGDEAAAWGVVGAMAKHGLRPDHVTCSALLNLYVDQGDEAGAERAIHRLQANHGVRPWGVPVYNTLLKLWYGHPERAHHAVGDMRAKGIVLDPFTAGGLIHAHTQAGDLEGAIAAFHQMEHLANAHRKGFVAWGALVEAHAALAPSLSGVWGVMEEMKAKGRVLPTLKTFDAVLERCERDGDGEGVELLLQYMHHWGIHPSVTQQPVIDRLVGR